jgi:hypothetical protein
MRSRTALVRISEIQRDAPNAGGWLAWREDGFVVVGDDVDEVGGAAAQQAPRDAAAHPRGGTIHPEGLQDVL